MTNDVTIDWVWETSRGIFVSVNGRMFGPLTVRKLLKFPNWMLRQLCDLPFGEEFDAMSETLKKVSTLTRGEWRGRLKQCDIHGSDALWMRLRGYPRVCR